MSATRLIDGKGNGLNIYDDNSAAVSDRITGAVAVTPNDGVDLAIPSKGLFIGGAGAVAVTMADGSNATFTGLAIGVIHPLSVKRVKATGTTATSILALY